MLFASGNAPPNSYLDEAGYNRLIASEDFRGAIRLSDVKVCYDENGTAILISYTHSEDVGYTPIRVQLNWALLDNPIITLYHSQGVGSGATIISNSTANCITITSWVRFKIGGLGNLGSYVLTGMYAPSAWVRIDYTICRDGSVDIKYSGSYIPSQMYYANDLQVGTHDMLLNSAPQINGFMYAGDCLDAPGATFHRWSGRAVHCG